jgi:hypothetical protein
MHDTSTKDGQEKRLKELTDDYREKGNRVALVRLIGGSRDDFGDYRPEDAGEAPQGAHW